MFPEHGHLRISDEITQLAANLAASVASSPSLFVPILPDPYRPVRHEFAGL